MSTDVEDALRLAFREVTEGVVPGPEPMRRLLARRRRRRRLGLSSLAASVTAVVVAALLGGLQSAPAGGNRNTYPINAPGVQELLDSPTRGSLADDDALLRTVTREARDNADGTDRIKVLFLGDVLNRRFLMYARFDDTSGALYFNDTAPGAPVSELVRGGAGGVRLTPLVTVASAVDPVVVGLAPAGCVIAGSADGVVERGGHVRRTWTDSPDGSWITRAGTRPAERWRVTCAGRVTSEAPAVPFRDGGADLVALNGLPHEPLQQRWTGAIRGAPGRWTLSTAALEGGGVAAVLTSRGTGGATVATAFPPDVAVSDGPAAERSGSGLASTAISADPHVVAVRVPERIGAGTYWSRLVVVFTDAPDAWWITGPAEAGMIQTHVDQPVTQIGVSSGTVTVTSFTDKVLDETVLPANSGLYFGEPLLDAW